MSATPASVAGGEPRVLIVGAGFAGLAAAKTLRRSPVQVTLVDQHNHHVFTPLLYQVATALLEPSEVAQPVRSLICRSRNVAFCVGRVADVDLLAKRVQTDHVPICYDYLVLAAGSVSNYFHNTDIATRSLGLKDLAEALQLRNQILSRFEQASRATDPAERAQLLSFAVVGGGPTGVEFAAALAVLMASMVKRDFPALDGNEVKIVLVEGADAPLGSFAQSLRASATRALRVKGVEVRSGVTVADVDDSGLTRDGGERIDAATDVWAAGVRAAPLAEVVGVTLASHGRVPVGPTLRLADHPDVFVVGDLAEMPTGKDPLPMLAQVAIQSGRYAARAIAAHICDERETGRFATATSGRWRRSGATMPWPRLGRFDCRASPAGWLAGLAAGPHRAYSRAAGPRIGGDHLDLGLPVRRPAGTADHRPRESGRDERRRSMSPTNEED